MYSSTSAPGYGSIVSLEKASGLSRRKVLAYLHTSSTYTKFKSRRRKFKRLKVGAQHINDTWSMDLAQMDELADENGGVKYILVAVDVLSRFTRVSVMKNKTAAVCLDAFTDMLDRARGVKPQRCWVDDGSEFLGDFSDYCMYNDIQIYSTFSETKSVFAERYIRSLKNIIYRYMEEKKTFRYVDQIQKFVKIMNERKNRVTLLAPANVREEHTEYLKSLRETKGVLSKRMRTPKFRVGQGVRIAHKEMPFNKGYRQQFTTETFVVSRVMRASKKRAAVTYNLQDVRGEPILGRFYGDELVAYRYNESNKRARHQTTVS